MSKENDFMSALALLSGRASEMQAIERALSAVANRSQEFDAFRAALAELNSTLVDLLSKQPAAVAPTPAPDVVGPLMAALQGLQLPAPQVTFSPQLVTPKGERWDIEMKRTPDGARMTVTKL